MKKFINLEEAQKILCEACGNAACPRGLIPRCSYYEKMQNTAAADVIERKPLPEDVETLIKDLYGFAQDCTDNDMCRDCQMSGFCDDGWPPNAIAHLIEAWNAEHTASPEKKKSEWISVKERMPKDGQEVIAFTKDKIMGFMDYRGESSTTEEWWIGDFGNALRYDDVTHWMPRPEPPKEETCTKN